MNNLLTIKPSFYNSFKCIADKCTDSCCVGWEIVVDEKTKAKYDRLTGEFGEKIKKNLITDEDGCICFKLCENERCPFLNEKNLCEIIITCNEDALCDICREHPRFYNEFSGAFECGLGLCCEEVCRLLLENDEPLKLEVENDFTEEPEEAYVEISEIREQIYNVLSGKESYNEKIQLIKDISEKAIGENVLFDSDEELLKRYSETEPINEEWSCYINDLQKSAKELLQKEKPFDETTNGNKIYSKLLSYIMFRHLSNSIYDENSYFNDYVSFCVSSVRFIKLCDIKTYCETGSLTLFDRIENVKRWSKQIEYSDVNMNLLMG